MRDAPTWLKGAGSPAPEQATPAGVLFVCTGNICRSAFAESYLRHRLAGTRFADVPVSSAGTMAVVDHAMDDEMAHQARLRGADPTAHVARQVTGRMLKSASAVIVFAPEHVAWIAREHPEYLSRVVALGQAAEALRSLPGGGVVPGGHLAQDVHRLRPQPRATDWIADPFRQGPLAAQRAADRIAGDLDVVVDRVV